MIQPHELKRAPFTKAVRGYNPTEVDEYIEFLIDKYTQLYKENAELREQVKQLDKAIEQYRAMEETLQKSIVLAQTAAEDIKKNAAEKANVIINEAQTKSESMHSQIDQDIQSKRNELASLQAEVTGYKSRIKGICGGLLEMLDKLE